MSRTAYDLSAVWGRPADRAVAEAATMIDPIGLKELMDLAELQTRVDRKYFVPAAVFRKLIAELRGELRVLEIDGRRTFGYKSVYFDTPRLTNYRAHIQRRRQRFKVRTRTYTDSGLCMFEVKLTGSRGATVKERVPHPIEYSDNLTSEAMDHLRTSLSTAFNQSVPPGLQRTLTTTYRRTTYVSRTGELRLTCDVGLVCRDNRHEVRDNGTYVLVESKSAGRGGAPERILRELGVRPLSVSKYCVGIAALHPELPSNPWHHTLERYFGPRTVLAPSGGRPEGTVILTRQRPSVLPEGARPAAARPAPPLPAASRPAAAQQPAPPRPATPPPARPAAAQPAVRPAAQPTPPAPAKEQPTAVMQPVRPRPAAPQPARPAAAQPTPPRPTTAAQPAAAQQPVRPRPAPHPAARPAAAQPKPPPPATDLSVPAPDEMHEFVVTPELAEVAERLGVPLHTGDRVRFEVIARGPTDAGTARREPLAPTCVGSIVTDDGPIVAARPSATSTTHPA
jgi:VTC domain